MRIASTLLLAFLTAAGCACPDASPAGPPAAANQPAEPTPAAQPAAPPPAAPAGGTGRAAAVEASHPQYERVEGTSFQNGCQQDDQCFVGGCSSEVCSAEEGVSSTCEAPAAGWPISGASCGCVSNQCVWYRESGSPAEPPSN
jgi:eight-cysteine-cluster-containing protein